MTKKYSATIIGSGFSLLSLLLTRTFIVPIFSIVPAAVILEGIFGNIFGKEPFNKTGWAILLTLAFILLLSCMFYYRILVKNLRKGRKFEASIFLGFLVLQSFIIHPFGFYLSLAENWSNASDGQIVFGIIKTFPISCFGFVIFGFLTDLIKNRKVIQQSTINN